MKKKMAAKKTASKKTAKVMSKAKSKLKPSNRKKNAVGAPKRTQTGGKTRG